MSKWNLIVDVARCENCHNCTLSVKDEHVDNDFPGYAARQPSLGQNWMWIERNVRGSGHATDVAYLPSMCNHCDDAPCLKAGGSDGSVRKRADGIVLIDPEKAKGRKDLVAACPYGAISWNEELSLPQIWIFDAHLLDNGWKEPRASHACPTEAMRAVKVSDEEMARIARAEDLRVLKPELGTKPRIYYRNLHRFDKCFIAGSVSALIDGEQDLVQGALVQLFKDHAKIAEMATDIFGDFKFDGIEPASGGYKIIVEGGSGARCEKALDFVDSVHFDLELEL